jgi:G:T/U-mismatch repair DNA glycosylase
LDKLPDQLQHHLRLVFVGTAASQRSANLGHYYAHPGNRFWRTIHEVGITPRRYAPDEFPALLKLGIGFTDLCKLGAGMDHQALAFPVDIPAFREKMRRYRPKTVAFTSKRPRACSLEDQPGRSRWAGNHRRKAFPTSSCWPRHPARLQARGRFNHGRNWRIGSNASRRPP